MLCIAWNSPAQIIILPVFGDKAITEDTWFVTKNGDSIQLDNIRFYLSNIYFESIDNQILTASQKAYLIDIFEPETCHINASNIDFKQCKTIHFNIGIDSLTNVSGALGGDLDPQKGMYWAWQSGYINLKIEGKSPQSPNRKHAFHFHIGGYLQPFYAMKNVVLNTKNQTTEGVVLQVDFSKFFDNINITTKNSIMIPCREAMQLADESVKMFSIIANEK